MEQGVFVEMSKELYQEKAYFHSETHINLESTDKKKSLANIIYEIITKIDKYQLKGSDWYFKRVIRLEIHTVEYKPMNGSSYIPLSDFILRKKAIVNIQNKNEKCLISLVST